MTARWVYYFLQSNYNSIQCTSIESYDAKTQIKCYSGKKKPEKYNTVKPRVKLYNRLSNRNIWPSCVLDLDRLRTTPARRCFLPRRLRVCTVRLDPVGRHGPCVLRWRFQHVIFGQVTTFFRLTSRLQCLFHRFLPIVKISIHVLSKMNRNVTINFLKPL
jgi:hypothetical protein